MKGIIIVVAFCTYDHKYAPSAKTDLHGTSSKYASGIRQVCIKHQTSMHQTSNEHASSIDQVYIEHQNQYASSIKRRTTSIKQVCIEHRTNMHQASDIESQTSDRFCVRRQTSSVRHRTAFASGIKVQASSIEQSSDKRRASGANTHKHTSAGFLPAGSHGKLARESLQSYDDHVMLSPATHL